MNRHDPFFVGAMGTTVDVAASLDPVADDLAAAMLTFRRQCVDRAFKTVEVTGNPVHYDFQGLVVFVTADFTSVHMRFLSFVEMLS